MSYDVLFTPAPSGPAMTPEVFVDYFAGRENYEVNGEQAWYSNDDTGVYFSLEYDASTEQPADSWDVADEGEEWGPTVATFSVNLNRPSFFALEAAAEVEAFVSAFRLGVDDPQPSGMGHGPFVLERFIAGWTEANTWACAALSGETSPTPLLYPGDRLQRIWRWNFQRKALQRELGEGVFVPKVSFATVEGALQAFVVWPDAIASYVPEVDVVVLVRDELASWRWFRKSPEMLLAPWKVVASAIGRYPMSPEPQPHVELHYDAPPADLVQFVQGKWPKATKRNFAAVPADRVLDAEYFAPRASPR